MRLRQRSQEIAPFRHTRRPPVIPRHKPTSVIGRFRSSVHRAGPCFCPWSAGRHKMRTVEVGRLFSSTSGSWRHGQIRARPVRRPCSGRHRHLKVPDLGDVSRVFREVLEEWRVCKSCGGDVRGAGRRLSLRPIGRAGLPHGQEDRGKLPADGHDGLLHAGSLRDPKAPGF